MDVCAFDFPQANNKTMFNSCQDTCIKLSASLETNIQNPRISTPYDYCQDEDFVPNIDSCASCYSVRPDQVYLSNCATKCLSPNALILTSATSPQNPQVSLHHPAVKQQRVHRQAFSGLYSQPTFEFPNKHRSVQTYT